MTTVPTLDRGVLSEENASRRRELIKLLQTAYWMEIETVMSYIASSINPDGVRAQEIIEHLQTDIEDELGHPKRSAIDFYNRILGFCDHFDLVTQDMVIDILRDEEGHLRLFEGFLREFELEGLA